MDLPSVEELADRAVNALLGAMTGDAWGIARAAFGKFLGRGRSTPQQEEAKLDKQRATLQSAVADGRHVLVEEQLTEAWRGRFLDLLEFREGAVRELADLLTDLRPSVEHRTSHISVTATESSVVQVATGDFTAGDQNFGLKSRRGRIRSQNP